MILSLAAAGAAAQLAPSAQWAGTVAAVSGDDLSLVGVGDHFRVAGSAIESLSGKPVPAANLAPGSSVMLRVGPREADGRFRADSLRVEAKSPMSLTGEITGISSDRRRLEVHGVEVELDDHTAFSGRAGAAIGRSARSLQVGLVVRVDLMPALAGVLRAGAVRFQNAAGEPNEDQELKGTVNAITDAAWTIDGRVFAITEDTVFEGDPQVGDFVEVKFHLDADGNAVADRIEKENDPNPDEGVEFTGIVEAIGDSSWTISGHVLAVNASTEIDGAPAVGDTVEVHAVTLADGTLRASRIQKEDPNGDDPGDDHGHDGPGDDNGQQTGPDGQNSGSGDSGNHSGSGSPTTPTATGGHGGHNQSDDGSDD
jgi:hypothetical protein